MPSTDLQIYGKTVSRLRIFTNLLQNKIAAKKRTEFDTKLCNKNGTKAHKSRQILNSRPTELCMLRQNFWGALLSRSTASATLSKCPPSIRDYVIYGQPKAVNQERRSGWVWVEPQHLVFGTCSNKYWSWVWLGICIIRIRQKRWDKKSTDSTLPLLLIIVTISDNEVAIIIILAIVIRVFKHIPS